MIEYRTIADELREIVGSADTYYHSRERILCKLLEVAAKYEVQANQLEADMLEELGAS